MTNEVICVRCLTINSTEVDKCIKCKKQLYLSYWWEGFINDAWKKVLSWFFGITILSVPIINIDKLYIILGGEKLAEIYKPPEVESIKHIVVEYGDNKAELNIHLLTDDFKWEIGYDQELNKRFSKLPLSPQMVKILNEESDFIICVGASSEEIKTNFSLEEGRKYEEDRAGRRAEKIAEWVRERMERGIPVLKLNAGHWLHATGGANTDQQRRVIIITVRLISGVFDKDEALRQALIQKSDEQEIYRILLTEYSLTRGAVFHWVP